MDDTVRKSHAAMTRFARLLQMFETLKGSGGSGTPWQVAEAAIFIMAAVAKYIDL